MPQILKALKITAKIIGIVFLCSALAGFSREFLGIVLGIALGVILLIIGFFLIWIGDVGVKINGWLIASLILSGIGLLGQFSSWGDGSGLIAIAIFFVTMFLYEFIKSNIKIKIKKDLELKQLRQRQELERAEEELQWRLARADEQLSDFPAPSGQEEPPSALGDEASQLEKDDAGLRAAMAKCSLPRVKVEAKKDTPAVPHETEMDSSLSSTMAKLADPKAAESGQKRPK